MVYEHPTLYLITTGR